MLKETNKKDKPKKGNENNKSKNTSFLISLIIPLLIILFKPLDLNLNQSIILATLILVLTWWTSGVINKTYASIFLLVVFSIFGETSLKTVFRFPLSSNFYFIALSFLLSQGITNSNLANRIANLILNKYGHTPQRLIILSFIMGLALIFVIPQPFARLILLASIFEEYIRNKKINNEASEILLFSLFVVTTSTFMIFLNGDVILNSAALEFGNISLSWMEWAKYMTLPSFLACLLIMISLILFFRKELSTVDIDVRDNDEKLIMGKNEKMTAIIMGIVILLWGTEAIHSINSVIVMLFGTVAMFALKIIDYKDLKSINIDLMVFLTAAFSIGGVMNSSGVANIIYSSFTSIFPETYSNLYLLVIVITVMALHMVLGSSITTLSVVVPGLIELTKGAIAPIPLILMVYISVNIHYILPLHHVGIMIGAGSNYYSSKIVMKYGLVLTTIVFLVIFGLYLPWWRLIGLI